MSVVFPGKDYGLKVLDPSDNTEIFNAKYPIFGSDITNEVPQIVTTRVIISNSSGKFGEPTTPTINWVNDNNWHDMTYNQLGSSNYFIGRVAHGQIKEPIFMTTGKAHVKHAMKVRYWQRDQDGVTINYNSAYNATTPASGYLEYDIPPSLGGADSFTPFHGGIGSDLFTFTGVGPYASPVYGSINFSNISCYADDTYIYITANIYQNLYHQRYRDTQYNFGWDRYEKYWSDFSGSWYDFTFYILPYNRDNDIYIR